MFSQNPLLTYMNNVDWEIIMRGRIDDFLMESGNKSFSQDGKYEHMLLVMKKYEFMNFPLGLTLNLPLNEPSIIFDRNYAHLRIFMIFLSK